MFVKYGRNANTYQDVATTSSVATADPHQLILLLFDGALSALAIAKGAIAKNAVSEKGVAISKAIDIIANGLKASLNLESGGELSERLAALYDYMVERLLHANQKSDLAALEEVSALLAEIHSAWAEIRPHATKP